MDDILLLDAVERYLKGEMSPAEKAYFEDLRNKTPEIDQMVVEHNMFLHQIEAYGDTRDLKHQLDEIHCKLMDNGEINEGEERNQSRVITLWNKYKRVTGIAASIAGITTLFVSALVLFLTPVPHKNELQQMSRELKIIKNMTYSQENELNKIKSKVPVDARPAQGGTSFLIDTKGYLVTNEHVVRGASTIVVQDHKGQQYQATIVHIDAAKDLAILKIEDADFKPLSSLPYSIRKSSVDLGEQLFTLGYPRDEIVYNEGYMSARTGYNGDTMTCQVAVSANPGNSGGPVLNKQGEVIGVLSTAQTTKEGVVFAVKAKNIFKTLEDIKKDDTAFAKIKLPVSSSIKNLDRPQQIKQIEECIFMVKTYAR